MDPRFRQPSGRVPFEAHIELLHFFAVHRDPIVESIQAVLNAQRKPIEYLQDASRLSRDVEDCFFTAAGLMESQSRLRGQLEDAQSASGFKPRSMPDVHNGLIDPGEIAVRVFYLWRQTRWPGRNGRVRYAHTLFNLYVIRCLELLSLRLWDDGTGSSGPRLTQAQGVLDRTWATAPVDQPVFVRDARWLIQMAQSPATDDLGAYFRVAAQIAESLSEEDRIGIHTAGVRMTGGHLRSQTRYYSMKKAVPVDETSVVLMTRTSNALDFALLIQELVPLLDAYEHALNGADDRKRLELADAICQGVSADPELFLNRVELLGAYSMIEPLFIATDGDEHAAYTAMGQRHVQLIHKYEERLNRLARPLSEDCSHFRPTDGAYSPYRVVYGFSSHLIEHMALKASQPDAVRHFSLEDVFVGGGADKLAWVNGWRKLPHLTLEVQARFEYPHQFALEMFERVENAFHRRVSGDQSNAIQTGRLFVVSADAPHLDSHTTIEALPSRFIESSDRELVAARKAEYCDEARLLSDRQEGRSLLSYQTSGGRVSITKSILTEVLGAGRDVKVDLPPAAARVLKLMSPRLVTCVASP